MVSWIPKSFSIGFLTWTTTLTGMICLTREGFGLPNEIVGQARQYWMNVEKLMRLRHQEAIQTWDEMKQKHQEKYLPVSYKRLLDQWQFDSRQSTSIRAHQEV